MHRKARSTKLIPIDIAPSGNEAIGTWYMSEANKRTIRFVREEAMRKGMLDKLDGLFCQSCFNPDQHADV